MALKKANFIIIETKKTIPVYFNPEEYNITNNNTDNEDEKETLSLKLYFDTYMIPSSNIFSITSANTKRIDVRSYTDPIVKLIEFQNDKSSLICFKWGSLNFQGRMNTVNQNFTMFLDDGMPVRAIIDVSMRGKNDIDVSPINNKGIDWSNSDWKKNILITSGIARMLLEKSSNE